MTTVSPLGVGLINGDGTVNPQVLIQLLNDLRNGMITVWLSGTTAQRPIDPYLGQIYYDTTVLGLVICTAIRNGAVAAVWAPVAAMPLTPNVTVLTGSGNYTPLTDCLLITAVAAGGGCQNLNGGAGSGEFCRRRIYACTAGVPIAYVVGQGVAAAVGGSTTFGVITLLGGKQNTGVFGNGGGRLGATVVGTVGGQEAPDAWGGSAGGNAATVGGPFDLITSTGNNSGASSYFGPGGVSGAGPAATAFGAGCGALVAPNTAGANGTIIVEEIGS